MSMGCPWASGLSRVLMRLGFRVSGRDVLFRVEILIIDLKIIT